MSEMTFQLSDVLWVLGFISAIYGFYKIGKEIIKPYKELEIKVNKNVNDMIVAKKEIERSRSNDTVIMKSLLAMIDHMVTGNGIENLKEIKKELTNFIFDSSDNDKK